MSLPELQSRLQTVRGHYRVTPWITPREDESPLLRSWQRCRDAGMRDHERVNFELVSRAALAELDDRHGDLVRAARPETERLAYALRGSGCSVLMFNTRGVVIDRLCHEAATPSPLLMSTRVGMNISEQCLGTTAPAIALAEGLPYLVGRDAHFFSNMRPFFCVAAPIDAPDGQRLGALDITTYDSVPAFDVYSLVVDAAAAIENSLFRPARDRVLVHFHPRPELVGTAMQGLLEVGADGRVSGANRVASRLLCQPRSALVGAHFDELFDRRLQGLFASGARQRSDLAEMQTRTGLQVQARFAGLDSRADTSEPDWRLAASPAASPSPAVPPVASNTDYAPCMREVERQTIEKTLAALGGNVSATARQLGISRNTIYRRRLGVDGAS